MRIGLVVIVVVGLLAAVAQVGWQQGPPLLAVNQTVDQSRIFVKGSGLQPDTATVTLTLKTPSSGQRLPVDMLIVIDRSATIDLASEQDAALQLVAGLGSGDRVGVASFNDQATLDLPLTPVTQLGSIRGTILNLVAGGPTAIGEGLAVATSELSTHGNTGSRLIEVLLSDGFSDAGRDPLQQATLAGNLGIAIYTIGFSDIISNSNRLNSTLLQSLAQTTGGQFFESFTSDIIGTILNVSLPQTAVVRTIQIIETLSPGLTFDAAQQNGPTVTANPDGSTRLSWQVASLDLNATWTSIFTVSGATTGTFSLDQAPSTITFTSFQGQQVSENLPNLSLQVNPFVPQPAPAFDFTPSAPTQLDTITFNDHSSSPNGKIASWHWDFGDGTTSNDQNPTHRYAQDGAYKVALTVTDSNNQMATLSKNVTVFTAKLAARRTINTFLPVDGTIPGITSVSCKCTFKVTLDVQINTELNGLGVQEDLPSGWTIQPLESGKGSLFTQGSTFQWIFAEKLEPGDTRQIAYEVTVPGADSSGKLAATSQPGVYQINGLASSAAPSMSVKTSGDGQITLDDGFSAKVVVAHWNKDATNPVTGSQGALDLTAFPNHTIAFDQIQAAIGWWLNNQAVPYTSAVNKDATNVKLDFSAVETLVAYWLTNTSVFSPLPTS
jgi:PKD repeat protein